MWPYKAAGRGPQHVAEVVLMPLMKEWRSDPKVQLATCIQTVVANDLALLVMIHLGIASGVDVALL